MPLDEHGQGHQLDALNVDVLDTTGAGDALNGILAAGLAAGLSLTEAARQAVIGATFPYARWLPAGACQRVLSWMSN